MWLKLRSGLALLLLSGVASAAQTDVTISMAAAPAAPRLLGPRVIGSKPGSPLLYSIPATGQAPLDFSAEGLPAGLTLDATSGTLSGTTPAAGTYPITLSVTNGSGSASATLTLEAGPTLALTPPMGWNSYDSFGANVKESDVLAAAKAMKTLLQPYGWNTVVIDYLWYDPEQTIDTNGRWLPSKSKYPSATGQVGFKSLADQVHALGLSFGIHLMRGIPRKSFTQNTPILESSSTASQAGNSNDTCSWDNHMYGVRGDTEAGKAWYDSIYAQYASWGVDFVKVDDMMNPYGGNVLHTTEVQAVAASIAKTGRSMILSLSPGPNQTKDVAVLNANANMWRTVNDFWDTNGLSNISDEFTATYNWSTTSGVTRGHWPDADMLPLGTIGNRACAFSHNQQVMVMTLWAIMPSPLMFGGQPTKLSNDAWTLALLTNEEVLAVNQDELGNRAKRVAQQGSTEVWAKDLSGGRKAVALFNRGTNDATVSATFTQLGVTGAPSVRDVWQRADVSGQTSGVSANVPHEAAVMYVLTPPGGTGGTGSGGAGGATNVGGASAKGGASARGGATSTNGGAAPGAGAGGVPASGGSGLAGSASGGVSSANGGAASSAGGSTLTTGGNPQTPNGGSSPGLGGAKQAGGTANTAGSGSNDDSGCSCSVPAGGGHSVAGLLSAAGALAALFRRRKRALMPAP